MPISDVDPDELDDDGDSRRWRWRWLAALGVLAIGLVGGGLWWAARSEPDDSAAAVTTDAPTTTVEAPPKVEELPPPVLGFPDWGSDYVGDVLPELYSVTNEVGITVNVHQLNWDVGPGVAIEFVADEQFVVEVLPPATIGEPFPEVPNPPVDPGPGWVPPGFCSERSAFRVTMQYRSAVGTSTGTIWHGTFEGLMATMFSAGHAEGDPFRVVVLQVDPTISRVSITFSDGRTDTAVVTDGWAAVATPGASNGKFDLTVIDDGVERVVPWQDLMQPGDARWQQACSQPPARLPDPGDVQPADPVAAEGSIRERFDLVYDRSIPADDKPEGLLDDETGVAAAQAAVADGPFADTASTAVHTMGDLVFTSDTEAWFTYSIRTDTSSFDGRFGVARLIDGEWRILRAVVCQDLALASAPCDPPVNELFPPA